MQDIYPRRPWNTNGIRSTDVVDSLGKRDLNQDGNIINLAIVGSSRFYDLKSLRN